MRDSRASPRHSTETANEDPHLAALERQLRQKGHLVVARQKGSDLYNWTHGQRLLWQRGRLDHAIERKLDAMGFPFEVEDCEWEHAFAQVANCRRQRGRLPAPSSSTGRWLQYQRDLRQAGTLPPNREGRLAAEGAFDPPGSLPSHAQVGRAAGRPRP
jgi:hypothetical protein